MSFIHVHQTYNAVQYYFRLTNCTDSWIRASFIIISLALSSRQCVELSGDKTLYEYIFVFTGRGAKPNQNSLYFALILKCMAHYSKTLAQTWLVPPLSN